MASEQYEALIQQYLAGPQLLKQALDSITQSQLDCRAIEGQWTIRELVCHLADFEPVYGDRIKRVLAEERPTLMGGDPDQFLKALAYSSRSIEAELAVIEATRRSLGEILVTLTDEQWKRVGIHSRDGELSIEQLILRITGHIPHHLKFVAQKLEAMQSAP